MDRDSAVKTIGRRLGNRTDQDARIVELMDLAQMDLEQDTFIPWFLVKFAQIQNIALNLDLVPVPTDFIVELEDGDFREYPPGTTVGRALSKTDYQDITRRQEINNLLVDGAPTHYAMLGGYFRLGPEIPTTQNYYKFWYMAKDVMPSTLAGNETNFWLTEAPEVILCMTGIKIASEVRDADAIAIFTNILFGSPGFPGAKERLRLTHESRDSANQSMYMDPR